MRPHGKHGPPAWVRRRRGIKGLQGRLLLWFLAAITLAIGASVLTTVLTSSPDNTDYPSRVVSRHVQQRVARLWDDPVATDAYVAQLRDNTGLDLHVRRDPNVFPQGGARGAQRNGTVFEDGVALIPIVKHGEVVGALELRTGTQPPQAWRVVVALLAALGVLGVVARRVSMHLARPLEHVAATADKFGSGDLAARTGVDKLPRRWVAEEVRDLGRAFDSMADRISRVVLEQRELLAAISHELRSPLGRARVALEIARERSGEDADGDGDGDATTGKKPITRSLDDVDKQLIEVDAILGDLLASARAGLADLRCEPIDIVAWIEQKTAAETTGPVEVISKIKESDAVGRRAEVDPPLLGRALHNILTNAWAHGHPKDEPLIVTIANAGGGTTTTSRDAIRVTVRDHGPGFTPEILARAFDPFVTGTGAARSPGLHGIGLGLSLVRRIVEAHGGVVSAENVEGEKGAIVTFELPRKAKDKKKEEASTAADGDNDNDQEANEAKEAEGAA